MGGQGRKQGRVVGIIAKPLAESIRQSRATLPRFAPFEGMPEDSEPTRLSNVWIDRVGPLLLAPRSRLADAGLICDGR